MNNNLISGVAAGLSAITFAFVTGAFAQSPTFTTQSYPLLGNDHVAADFNGDGRPDLAGTSANGASVMLGNGDGTFRPATNFPLGAQTQSLAAGDFNGDGKMDLAVTLDTPQFSLALLTGTGTGSFNQPVFFANTSGFDSPAIVAADLNNDGKLDVVLMHNIACFTAPCTAAHSVTVLLGNGDGTFQPAREVDVAVGPHAMAVGDFNRDGFKDLAVGGENTELAILLGLGDGTFARQPTVMLVAGGDLFSACNDIDVADFNRDTIPDLVVPLGNGNGNAILLGRGDGGFVVASRILTDAVSAPLNIAVADYNGDGFVDLARGMGDGTRGLMQIMNGNGNGTFQPPINYLVPAPQSSVAGGVIISADFNGDVKPDIALQVRGASAALDVLTNSGGTPPPPAAVTVSGLGLNPTAITGGTSATGTVTLSARAQTATPVALASSNAAARVPASVTVAAGASSANFNITTTQVSSATAATISATLNGTTRSASLTINANAPPASDTVTINRAEYDSAKRVLRVEASSTQASATLQTFVSATGQLIGTLTNNGGGKFSGQFAWSVNPQNISVRSSSGGQKSGTVAAN